MSLVTLARQTVPSFRKIVEKQTHVLLLIRDMAETKWAMAWRFVRKENHNEETNYKPKNQCNIAGL